MMDDPVDNLQSEETFDDGSWVKFNDQIVVPTFKHVAIGTGQGGYTTSYRCHKLD